MPFSVAVQPTATDVTNAAPSNAADRSFKFRRIVILGCLIAACFALVPFYPTDLDFYAGGLGENAFPRNHLGAIGTYFGWSMLMTLGLSSYLLLAAALLCSLRRLVWRGKLRRSSWKYFLALPLLAFGTSLLLGLFPDALAPLTSALNIRQLPGGVLGQLLCAPGSGLLFVLLNYTGCMIVAALLVSVGLGTIWLYDWAEIFHDLAVVLQRNHDPADELAPQSAVEQPTTAPAVPETPPTPPAAQPQPVTPPAPRRMGFQGRRAGAQQPTVAPPQHPTYDPVAPKPHYHVPVQPELPTPTPAPPPPPTATAPTFQAPTESGYVLPGINLFNPPKGNRTAVSAEEINSRIEVIQRTLDDFGVDATVINAVPGPQITLYEIEMGNGIKPDELNKLHSTLLMNLQVTSIRLLTPIPGRPYAGVEVPNKQLVTVTAYELFTSQKWLGNNKDIPLMLGKNISGQPVVIDLAKAPHLLVAGSTGSGKSVTMNMMIQSILLRFSPDQLKLIMFDPKYLEFAAYSKIPHLLSPVINEPQQVGTVLHWACDEMNRRYRQIATVGAKKIQEFNARPHSDEVLFTERGEEVPQRLPYIVIIIDELADIMAQAQKEVDHALGLLAGKARAAGIHMIIATQRPDAKVITGVVKANFPWRIALQVTDLTNSRVIMDQKGAEMLLGKGDMLLKGESREPERIQSGFASNEEIAAVVRFCSDQAQPVFDESIQAAIEAQKAAAQGGRAGADEEAEPGSFGTGGNDLISRAVEAIVTTKRPTISNLQRRLGIGYNRAATLIEELEDLGYVGPQPASGMREIYWDNLPTDGGAPSALDDEEDPADGVL